MCVSVLEPAAVARTSSAGLTPAAISPVAGSMTAEPMMPAAVMADTTPCPVASRISTVMSHAMM